MSQVRSFCCCIFNIKERLVSEAWEFEQQQREIDNYYCLSQLLRLRALLECAVVVSWSFPMLHMSIGNRTRLLNLTAVNVTTTSPIKDDDKWIRWVCNNTGDFYISIIPQTRQTGRDSREQRAMRCRREKSKNTNQIVHTMKSKHKKNET